MVDWDHVSGDRDGNVATITVDRPESYNAANMQVLEELADAVDTYTDDGEIRVLVLTGAGEKAFLSGIDIEEFHERSGVWWKTEFQRRGRRLEHAIETSPKPIIAAVNGYAFGGGTEIAMWCDMVFAAESATFGQTEIRMGLIPGGGGTQRLAHRVGPHRAMEIVLTGRDVPAREAEDIGLVNETVPDEDLYDRVYDLAAELADGPKFAQALAKEAIVNAFPGRETALSMEEALSTAVFESDDASEGVEAFLQNREPGFEE
jgi:enoyl-CoA hydratase/carnithine racemase